MSDRYALVSRRQFCGGACQVASGAALATLVAACSGGSSSSSPTAPSTAATLLAVVDGQFSANSVRVTVGTSALAGVGAAALVQSVAGLFLMSRTSTSAFSAIEAVCTHEGCTITGADGDIYVCPCHGSRYTRSGQVVNGPATASLRKYPTTFTDGVVTIAL